MVFLHCRVLRAAVSPDEASPGRVGSKYSRFQQFSLFAPNFPNPTHVPSVKTLLSGALTSDWPFQKEAAGPQLPESRGFYFADFPVCAKKSAATSETSGAR